MKTKRYLIQGFLLLLCSMTAMAQQVEKRPRIQTSASEQEIVFKPVTEAGKTSAAKDSQKKVVEKV